LSPVVVAWLILLSFVAPLLHVALSPALGPWQAPKDGRCPFSPRVGWLVIVLFLGPIGWLMFMAKRRAGPPAAP
jgi:hypothetical protein